MASYKRFEMQLMMSKSLSTNQAQNSMDFLLMPPPNMKMNTPFVLSGSRMGRAQPCATPFLFDRDTSDREMMDLDFDTAYWSNNNANKTNVPAKNGSSASDRVVFRTNGHTVAANRSTTATDATNRPSAASKNALNVENGRETQANAAKADLFNSNSTSKDAGPKASTAGSSSATKPIFGGQQHIVTVNAYASNVCKSVAVNEKLNTDQNGASGGSDDPFDEMNGESSNGHEEASVGQSVFSRLNFDSTNTDRNNAYGTQKSGANFTNAHPMNADDNDANVNDDIQPNGRDYYSNTMANNNGKKQSNDNLKMARNATSQTNTAHLFETAPFPTNGRQSAENNGGQSNSGKIIILSIQDILSAFFYQLNSGP